MDDTGATTGSMTSLFLIRPRKCKDTTMTRVHLRINSFGAPHTHTEERSCVCPAPVTIITASIAGRPCWQLDTASENPARRVNITPARSNMSCAHDNVPSLHQQPCRLPQIELLMLLAYTAYRCTTYVCFFEAACKGALMELNIADSCVCVSHWSSEISFNSM